MSNRPRYDLPSTAADAGSLESVSITAAPSPLPEWQAGRTRKGCKCGSPCFYCGGDLTGRRHEHDHFPLPWRHGGRTTVPACRICHDMKDRVPALNWPAPRFDDAVRGMPRAAALSLAFLRGGVPLGDDGEALLLDLSRKCDGAEARIAFAKFIGLALDEAANAEVAA